MKDRVLLALREEPSYCAELAERLGATRQALRHTIDRLIECGLVKAYRRTQCKWLELTPKGRAEVKELLELAGVSAPLFGGKS